MKIELLAYDLSDESQAREICEIIKKYFPKSPWPPSLEKIMKGGTRYYRALFQNEQIGITGYVEKTPLLAETVKTTIFEDHRGKGLGLLLSQTIEEECKKNGIKKIMTTIFSDNHPMISIKLKQGYVIEGFHLDHEAPGYHEYSLGKVLR